MSVQKLKRAPLKEVIFELFWSGIIEGNNIPQDLGFDNAVGKFWERIQPSAPIQKRLILLSAPIKVFGVPIYQYWKGELKWPVIQHGPGIITVNDIEANYEWQKTFKPLVLSTLKKLSESYEKELPLNKVSLRYIDSVDLNEKDIHTFVAENLQTSIIYNYSLPGEKKEFNLLQRFDLGSETIMQLQINSGLNNQTKKPAVIWTTIVEKKGKLKLEEVIDWLDSAHEKTSNIFKNMLNPEFYASLDQ